MSPEASDDLAERRPGAAPPADPSRRSPGDVLQKAAGLSDLDRGLIRLLQLNGRASYSSLAVTLGTTEKIVRGRVRALRDEGIIDITTVAHPSALGYDYVCMFGVRVDGTDPFAVAEQMLQIENVDYTVVTTGRYDVLVEIFAGGVQELSSAVERIRRVPGVGQLESHPYLRLHYQEGAFDVARLGRSATSEQPVAPVPLSETDVAIIQHLNEDGRVPFQHIGDELGISESQVRRRVIRLQRSGAVKIMAITNPMSLGLDVVAMLWIVAGEHANTVHIAEAVAGLPSVTYVAVCAGRFDLVVEVVSAVLEDLLQLLDRSIRPIPGVGHVETSLYLHLGYRRVRARASLPG